MKNSRFFKQVIFIALIYFTFSGSIIAEEALPTNYVLFFQGTEYNSKLGSAVEYFFKKMLKPEDNMMFFTPQKPYQYSQQTRQSQSLDQLMNTTKDVLKRDISMGAATYDSILSQMIEVINSFSGSLPTEMKSSLIQYRQLLDNLRSLRKWNEELFVKIAQMFKQNKGENHLIIFYQTEYRAVPNRKKIEDMRRNPDVSFDVSELFEAESTKDVMNADTVSQALKECGAKLDFIYLKTKTKRSQTIEMKEFSGDVYNVFSKIAKETGGKVINTSIPEAALKEISEDKK
jgi:hypothetical protein